MVVTNYEPSSLRYLFPFRRILLDGYDLREYNLAELRRQVGVIFQDYIRYQLTVSQNIAVGNITEKENKERIINAREE